MNAAATVATAKKNLTWQDLFTTMRRDRGGRWYAAEGSAAAEYIADNGYRMPSRAWPHSHSRPLLTAKFARWLVANHPAEAKAYGLAD